MFIFLFFFRFRFPFVIVAFTFDFNFLDRILFSLLFKTRTKQLNAGLFIKYKTGQEKISVKEIEAKIILDPHMAQQRLKDDEAKKNYLKAKTDYNNMLTEISLLQSELKRELQLMGKER